MFVKRLKLRNFRNYSYADVELNPHMNVISGNNAQGKTNLLESLVYLSLTRSHRLTKDGMLIKEGEPFSNISCVLEDDDIERELEAVIYDKGKTLMIHHQPVKRSSEFVGILNTVLFSPDDLTIFTDAPGDRRRLMNQEIAKVSNKYLLALNHDQSLLKERNLLLKNDHPDMQLLHTFDEQLSAEEYVIITERKKFVQEINRYISSLYQNLSDESTVVTMQYKCCMDSDVTTEALINMHQDALENDRFRKSTTTGVHHEDLIFLMDGENLIQRASQGQKRMTVLAFKMALMNYIRNTTGKVPVLLLDDVLSELDDTRQRKLIDMINGTYQCLITTVNVPDYLKDKERTEFHISHGTIVL